MIYSKEIAEAKNGSKIPLFKNGKPVGSIVAPESKARIESFIEQYM